MDHAIDMQMQVTMVEGKSTKIVSRRILFNKIILVTEEIVFFFFLISLTTLFFFFFSLLYSSL